jgi:hypothetical protein
LCTASGGSIADVLMSMYHGRLFFLWFSCSESNMFTWETLLIFAQNTFYLCWSKKNFKHLLLEKDFSALATNFSAFAIFLKFTHKKWKF